MNKDFAEGQQVKVIKAPPEAPHLLGKVGEVAYVWRTNVRVFVGDAFTDFTGDEIAPTTKG